MDSVHGIQRDAHNLVMWTNIVRGGASPPLVLINKTMKNQDVNKLEWIELVIKESGRDGNIKETFYRKHLR